MQSRLTKLVPGTAVIDILVKFQQFKEEVFRWREKVVCKAKFSNSYRTSSLEFQTTSVFSLLLPLPVCPPFSPWNWKLMSEVQL